MLKKRKLIITMVSIVLILFLFTVFTLYFRHDKKGDISYALKVNDTVISPKIYQGYLIQKTLLAVSQVTDYSKDIWEQKIDGLLVSKWIRTNAHKQIIHDTIVKEEIKKANIPVQDSDKERLETYLDQHWKQEKETYIENKCNRKIFNTVYEMNFNSELLFDQYGKDHPPKENTVPPPSATVTYFMMNLFGPDGNLFTEEQIRELTKLADRYVKQMKGKTSIDEVYQSYQDNLGEERIQNRPLTPMVISSDNKEFTSRIPKFVEMLMDAEIGTPFFVRDELYICVGIRQKDTENPAVRKAYSESRAKQSLKNEFEEYLSEVTEKAVVKINDLVIEEYSPESILIPETKDTESTKDKEEENE